VINKEILMAIRWVKSSYSDEKGEFEGIVNEYSDAADVKKNISYIKKQYVVSKQISLTNNIWSKLKNTDSYNTKTIEGMQKAMKANREFRDINRILKQFFSGKVQAPIIIKLGDGSYELIAGNTRLMLSRVLGLTPKVQVVDTDW